MSGWIRFDKALVTDPRVLRVAKAVTPQRDNVTRSSHAAVTWVLGGLVQLWSFADTHIEDDDTLALSAEEINDLVGIPRFAESLPKDWLEIVDADRVKLPDFHAHNGSEARRKLLSAARQSKRRESVTLKRDKVQKVGHATVTIGRDQTETETETIFNPPTPRAGGAPKKANGNGIPDGGSARVPTDEQRRASDRHALELSARANGIDPTGLTEGQINNRIFERQAAARTP
jgi:hypothetical protein